MRACSYVLLVLVLVAAAFEAKPLKSTFEAVAAAEGSFEESVAELLAEADMEENPGNDGAKKIEVLDEHMEKVWNFCKEELLTNYQNKAKTLIADLYEKTSTELAKMNYESTLKSWVEKMCKSDPIMTQCHKSFEFHGNQHVAFNVIKEANELPLGIQEYDCEDSRFEGMCKLGLTPREFREKFPDVPELKKLSLSHIFSVKQTLKTTPLQKPEIKAKGITDLKNKAENAIKKIIDNKSVPVKISNKCRICVIGESGCKPPVSLERQIKACIVGEDVKECRSRCEPFPQIDTLLKL